MMRSLYTAATGMRAQQTNVDNISNNLSNVNTVGYKTQKAEFKSLLYQTIQTRTTSANGEEKPIGAQVGLGTRIASNTAIFTQGALQASESNTDFAIDGKGFFAAPKDREPEWMTRYRVPSLSRSTSMKWLPPPRVPILHWARRRSTWALQRRAVRSI